MKFLCQIEKDEKFWIAQCMMTIFYIRNRVNEYASIFTSAFGDKPPIESLNDWQECFDGKSCLPLIKNGHKIRDKIFSFDGLCEDIRAVRTNNKKLIVAKNNFCNLCKGSHHKNVEEYDLRSDSGENVDIYCRSCISSANRN